MPVIDVHTHMFTAQWLELLKKEGGQYNIQTRPDGQQEIFGQRLDAATGTQVGVNDFRISDMGPDGDSSYGAFSPAVAYNGINNQYLVVWYGDDSTAPLMDDEFEIFGQRLNAATGAQVGANDFRISDMGPEGSTSYDASSSTVAYNSTNNEYLVVWQGDDNAPPLVDEEFEIFGQRLNAATDAPQVDPHGSPIPEELVKDA